MGRAASATSLATGLLVVSIFLFGGAASARRDSGRVRTFSLGASPVWSPDGTQIAYVGSKALTEVPRLRHVIVVAADGSGLRQVVATAPRGESLEEVRWAADKTFVYSDTNYTLWSVSRVRKAVKQLATLGLVGIPAGPFAISPDGRQVVFDAPCGCGLAQATVVETIAVGGGRVRRLSRTGASRASFSPDSRQLVLTSKGVLVVMPAHGGPVRSLGLRGYLPAWSPDGRWIAFQGADHQLEIVPAAGGTARTLVSSRIAWAGVVAFSWSPDSTKLVYYTNAKLGTVNLSGRTSIFSLHGLRLDHGIPQWSPDGNSIAFTAIDIDDGVYVIRANGTGIRRVA